MRAPIVSRKHIIQHTQFAIASATVTTNVELEGVVQTDVNTATEVTEGTVVKAIYLELWLLSTTANAASFVMMLEKSGSFNSAPSFSNMTTLHDYENKKNILYTTQGLLADQTGNPTPVIRQWIKVPKGKQRFGLHDELRVNIACIGADNMEGCGLAIYKSYS